MNSVLDPDSREALVIHRLQRARQTMAEAENAASGHFYNAAVNRLYYAAYYAASALMLCYDIKCTSHAGLKSMLNLHFVSTGRLKRQHGKTFSILFESRQSGDYDDFIYYDEDDYDRLNPLTAEFINDIGVLIDDCTQ